MVDAERVAQALRRRWPAIQVSVWDAQQFLVTVVHHIVLPLRAALTQRHRAVLCLPGGRSPVPLMEALSEQDLPWEHVQVMLSDERCVPQDHPDSNAGLVKHHLLRSHAARAALVSLDLADSGESTATILARNLPLLHELGAIDVCVLGMGADGHVASLFAGGAGWAAAESPPCETSLVVVDLPPGVVAPVPRRVSLTLSRILESGQIILPLAGDDKLESLAGMAADARAEHRYPAAQLMARAAGRLHVLLKA